MSRQTSGNKTQPMMKQYYSISKQNDELISSDQRILILENHLNCVSLQQDALMPLLQMIEYIPAIQRNDIMIKQMQKQLDNVDIIGRNLFNDSNSNSFQRQEQKINKTYSEISDKVFDLGIQIQKIPRQIDDNSITRSFESRSPSCDQTIRDMQKEFQSEFINIYREIGGLRNDIEYLVGQKKKKKMIQKTLDLGKSIQQIEKPFVMSYLEQELCIEDLFKYEQATTQRIREDIEFNIQILDQNIFMKPQDILNSSERLITLKYQLAASKKKYIQSLQKIDNQFNYLENKKCQLYSNTLIQQSEIQIQASKVPSNLPNLQFKVELNQIQKQNLQQDSGSSENFLINIQTILLRDQVNNIVKTIQDNLDSLGAQISQFNKLLTIKSDK